MRRIVPALLAVALLATGCSSIQVNTDYNPDTDFSRFATYMWIDTDGDSDDSLMNSRIQSAVDRVMQARGYSKVESGADLAVGYQLTSEERRSYTTVSTGWGGGWRWGGWGGMGVGTSTTSVNTWERGSLIVGIFEVSSEGLVWTGSASADIKDNLDPRERQERINNAVDKMMADFPPGS